MSNNENTTRCPWVEIEDEVTRELKRIIAMADLLSAASREGLPEISDRTIPDTAETIYWGGSRVAKLLKKLSTAENPEG